MSTFDPVLHRDLLHGPPGLTQEPAPPAGAGPTALMAAELSANRDQLTEVAVTRILEAVRGYRQLTLSERDDLWWSVHRNLETVLRLLVEGRPVSSSELAARRQLGFRRAQQGLPVEDVMRAFQVGYLVLWNEIRLMARRRGPEAIADLLDNAALIWTTMHEISSAVAEAYGNELACRDLASHRRGLLLLEGLRAWPRDADAVEVRARDAGFDPAGRYLVAVYRGSSVSLLTAYRALTVEQPDQTVALTAVTCEAADAEQDLAEALIAAGAKAVGVGLTRGGLAGAARSLEDAERAHRAARALGRDSMGFRESWMECLSLQAGEALEELVAPAVELLRAEPEMAATLEAFFAAGGRLTITGEQLHVHANTVGYRVERFTRRTGFDPRTTEGARAAQLALTLAAAVPAS